MRRSTFNINFFVRKNAPKRNGLAPLTIRLTIDGRQIQFNSKMDVDPKLWNQRHGIVIGKSKQAKAINEIVNTIRFDLHRYYIELADTLPYVTPEHMKNAFLGVKDQDGLIFVFNEYLKTKQPEVVITQKSYDRYLLARNRIVEFISLTNKAGDIPLHRVTLKFINEFYLYLREKYHCGNDAALKLIRCFASMMNYAERTGSLKNNPFMRFQFRFDNNRRGYLTKEEVGRIYDKKFTTQRLSQVQDIFIFSCYTGLSFADICRLSRSCIHTSFEGDLWIYLNRSKTGVESRIPMLPIPISIMEQYSQLYPDSNLLFPNISHQKTNEYLREIADLCGIEKDISYHVARHTFATMMLSHGVSVESVSAMLGHTNIKTTQMYARVTDRKIKEEMRGVK